jgi:hypothetical protein
MCTNGSQLWYDNHKAFFWILVTISALIALAGVFGNALVIFAAMKKSHIGSSFRYLNRVVLSLAISDFAYSLLGEPFFVVHWYWGKLIRYINKNKVAKIGFFTILFSDYRG